jgi:lipopolysaccharide export system protein LptA
MLVGTFAVLFTSYRLYAHFLGGIDGLPPLPEAYRPTSPDKPIVIHHQENDIDRKLQMAYGEECEEKRRPIKLEVNSKGVVLAADDFVIIKDGPRAGQIRLTPISLAIFSKKTPAGKYPEITTIRGEVAYLTFDRPVSSLTDMDKRRVVGCELIGKRRNEDAPQEAGDTGNGILVVHNRGTEGRDDDLSVYIPRGPVFYREGDPKAARAQPRKPEMWSDDAVELTDLSSKPQPSTIKATGLDIFLTAEQPAGRPPAGAPRKSRTEVTGVERIVLRSGVEMHLFVDSQSGFLKSGKPAPAAEAGRPAPGEAAPAPKKQDRSLVVITTHGPFAYDLLKDVATFDIPANPGGQFPEQVLVNRYQELDKRDQLLCERLVLQFRRQNTRAKPGAAAPASATEGEKGSGPDLEIENAHATGKEVVLTSDSEMLEAHGNDFFYNALTLQTTLKGDPEMWALKEGNEIHARELQITNQKGAQQGTAIGPGRMDLLDKKTGKRPLHARWRDKLLTTRDGKHDLLILIGDAAFVDDEQGQELKAETLKVWMEPRERDQPGPAEKPKEPAAERRPRPHHIEAIGRVQARSRELNIDKNDRLVLWFKDSPGPIPVPGPPAAEGGDSHSVGKPADQEIPGPSPRPIPPASSPNPPAPAAPVAPIPPIGLPGKPAAAAKPEAPGKSARPIDLSARVVEAHIIRTGEKNELDRLWTEGEVKVRQEGAVPTDRGIDIKGDTLQLTRTPEGNVIVVTGDLAELQLDKLFILGPEVNIDQAANKAWVNGTGLMQMESDTNFQGTKLKEPVPLTIHWDKSMFFNGTFAEFHGGIQAVQEDARLACQTLVVELDRAVSLREEERRDTSSAKKEERPKPKVKQLVCDVSVRVEETVLKDDQLVKYQRIESPSLGVDNSAGEIRASGPGVVRIFQPGPVDNGSAAPGRAPAKPAQPAAQEMKLTRVRYSGNLYANNKTYTASFYDNVEVVYLPTDDQNLEPDVDKLPEGGMYIRSNQLSVYNRQGPGKGGQEMTATGNVVVRANNFTARADVMHYNEAKDQVILEGKEGNLVSLYQREPNGTWKETRAQKVIYSRKTGQFEFIGGRSVQGN